MDYIKRKICLEGARTRTQGLMPYYVFGKVYGQHKPYYVSVCNNCGYSGETFDKCPRCGSTDVSIKPACKSIGSLELETADGKNGNWGQIVANPCFLSMHDKTYNTMLYNYYSLLNMVRDGIRLRKVETKDGEIIFTEDVGAFDWDGDCFSGGTEPDYLYEYAAYNAEDFTSSQIDSIREETRNIYRALKPVENDHVFIVLIKDYEKFQKYASYFNGVTIPSSVTDKTIGSDIHKRWADYCEIVDDLIGNIKVPASIFNKHIKVPKSMPCADVKGYKEWLENYQSLSADCCNMRLWEDMGGEDMLDFLSGYEDICQEKREKIEALDYSIPYIEISLLIRQNYTDIGVLTNIDGVDYDGELDERERPFGAAYYENKQGVCALTIDQIVMSSATVQYPISGDSAIEVESLLWTLRDRKKYTDDKDNLLPGIFAKFPNPAGQMYVCVKGNDDIYYQLTVVESAITEENNVYYVVYEEVSLSDEEKEEVQSRAENIRTSYTRKYDGPYDTEAEATEVVTTEQEKYGSESSNYRICVVNNLWEMKPLNNKQPKDALNGDGLSSADETEGGTRYPVGDPWQNSDGKLYRTITTQYSGARIAVTEEEEGNPAQIGQHYFFFVKYDNTEDSPMTIPYHIGNATNVYLVSSGETGAGPFIYRGDFINDLNIGNDSFEVTYVIGGYFEGDERGNYLNQVMEELGDVYYEKYSLQKDHVDYVALDGVDKVPVYSEYINFDGAVKEFYSPRYDLYRTGNTANIIKMASGEYWVRKNSDGYSYANDAYLTKEDYLTNFSLPPKVDVNVTIDRGGVSTFEKHYKLSECNTMQDLVNYGNNFFNI